MQQIPPLATTNHARLTDGVVYKRPRVNLVSDTSRSANARMDLSPKQNTTHQPCTSDLAQSPAPTTPGAEFEKSSVENRLADLQARLKKRGVKVGCTPKRRRVSDISERPDTARIAQGEQRKRALEGGGGNGRVVARAERKEPLSLWEQLADAAVRLGEQKRLDPRFVSGRRPLDCLNGLRVSIGVTLFADGYVRHDGLERKASDTRAFLRYPYDRNSREFLRCLDLGLIPTEEDLPEAGKRYYYDGCLVAEIRDCRLGERAEQAVRVLLRPDMASLYADIDVLTNNLDKVAAATVEEKLIKAIAPPLDCAPHATNRRLSSVLDTAAYSNTYAFNIGRRPKRRKISRPVGPPTQPRLSTAALLLISEAEKQQTMHWYSQQGVCVGASLGKEGGAPKQGPRMPLQGTMPATSIVAGVDGASIRGTRDEKGGLVSATSTGAMPSSSGGTSAGKEGLDGKRLMRKPPSMLLDLFPEKGKNASDVAKAVVPLSREKQERLRTAQLILPDQQTRLAFEQTKTQLQAAKMSESAEAIRSAEYAMQQVKGRLNQAGRQIYVLDLLRGLRGIETVIGRGLYGEKSKDAVRVILRDEKAGNTFLDQFKAIAKTEGYVCLQDMTANEYLAQQREQQMRSHQLQMKQSGSGALRQQGNPVPRGAAQNQNPAQAAKLAASLSLRSTQSHPQGNNIPRQQLLQLQKQKLLRRQQMQRQRQQQNAQVPIPGQQHHLQHVSPMHQPHHQNSVHNPPQHMSLPQAPQHQLPQTQHPAQLTIQQQLFQHQIHQRQLQQQLQQQQNPRGRRLDQQMQRHVKNAGNLQQSAAGVTGINGRGGQILSKGAPGVQGNVTTMGREGPRVTTGGLNPTTMGNLGSAGLLGHNQMFTPSHFQQIQQLRSQQLRQEQQRTMMATVGGVEGNGPFPRNGNIASANPMSAQHIQTQALAAVMGSGGIPSAAGLGVSAGSLTGTDVLANQRLQQHFKQQSQAAQKRENVEAQSRNGKR